MVQTNGLMVEWLVVIPPEIPLFILCYMCSLWIDHHPQAFFSYPTLDYGTFVAGAAGSGKLMAVDDVLLGLGNSVKLLGVLSHNMMGKGARGGPLNINHTIGIV